MSDIETMLNHWRQIVSGIEDGDTSDDHDENTAIMIIENWAPKVKWFQPPRWRIFRWAYKITLRVYTGVYPIAIGGDFTVKSHMDSDDPDKIGLNISFTCNPYRSEAIDKVADRLGEQLEKFKAMWEKEEDQC